MGLTKDLKKMSAAIRAKLGGGKKTKGGKKGFKFIHYLLVILVGSFVAFAFYHTYLRKKLNK